MPRREGLREIAEAAGVSIATVSRVLNNKPDVHQETRDRVMREVERARYEHRPTNGLPATAGLIGLVNTYREYRLSSDYVVSIAEGVANRVDDHGYRTVLVDSDAILREMRGQSDQSVLDDLAGLIWSMPVFQREHADYLSARGLPCVVINNRAPGVDVPFVESDNTTAIRQAIEYLVGMGHRRIGFIGGGFELSNMRERYDGYRHFMREHGLQIDEEWVVDDLSSTNPQSAIEGTHRLLGRKNTPSAIVGISQPVTLGIYEALRSAGVRIPDDVSVVSFDDPPSAATMRPALTTFRQPLGVMAARAVDLLMEILHHASASSARLVREQLTLIVRDSVRQVEA